MAQEDKPKSIFFAIADALRGNRKNVVSNLTNNTLLTNNPYTGTDDNSVQNIQQQYLDIQSLKLAQDLYSKSVYYDADRLSAYNDFRAMDLSPEISVALDIMADECVTRNDRGQILTIYSENIRIKKILQDLFHKTLNIDYNLWFWTRELLKYGDNFIKLELDQKLGIYDCIQLPTGELHKEVGFDGNPQSVRYKWDINNMFFEDFQVAHLSLISDGTKLPYGRSVLDPARKLWKQLQLAEDAMLVYRLVRAPERRIFYIEVGNMEPGDVKQYIESIKRELKKQPVVDQRNGNVNLKFNMLTFEEDYFMPIRGDKSSRIETLPGACLALDTKIDLLDGRSLTLNDIIKEYESGKKLETYSINPNTGEIVPGNITWAGITRKNTKVLKLILDNGQSIICTPDHKFPTKFNGKKEAKDLIVGESLWSFNKQFKPIRTDKKKKRNNYEQIYDHSTNKWKFTHRMVADFYKTFNQFKETTFNPNHVLKSKTTIHHINFNRYDNSSNNLTFMANIDHYEFHQKMAIEFADIGTQAWLEKYNTNLEFKNEVINRLDRIRKEYYTNRTEEAALHHNKNISEGLKKYIHNLSPEELQSKIKHLSKSQNKARATLNKKLLNKKYKAQIYAKVSAKSKITKNLSENIEKYKQNSKKNWLKPGMRERIVDSQTIKYSNQMLHFIIDYYSCGLSATEILNEINKPNSTFMCEFNKLNINNKQLKKMKNGFTHNNLYKMLKSFNYKSWRDFKSKYAYYNHKIKSIELLEDTIDTGTITIDGTEEFHNFHNFALSCGVFTQNSNLGDIMDIEYLQNKLFTAIKVPKTYLNYGEALPGGSTLSQADLRFSRTINRFQEAIVLELRRIANIHLFILGHEDDMDNFSLSLTNPSTQQELLKLETMKARGDVFKEMYSSDVTSPVSYTWAMEYILGFSKSEIKTILRQKKFERKMFNEMERAHEEYMDTGMFTELDRKFRKPGFDPNTDISGEEDGEKDNLGGSDGGFGGGSSMGLGDFGGDFGGGDEPLDVAPETGDSTPNVGTDTNSPPTPGNEIPEEKPEEDDTLKENNLIRNNQKINHRTKILLEGLDKFINKLEK